MEIDAGYIRYGFEPLTINVVVRHFLEEIPKESPTVVVGVSIITSSFFQIIILQFYEIFAQAVFLNLFLDVFKQISSKFYLTFANSLLGINFRQVVKKQFPLGVSGEDRKFVGVGGLPDGGKVDHVS